MKGEDLEKNGDDLNRKSTDEDLSERMSAMKLGSPAGDDVMTSTAASSAVASPGKSHA